MERTEGSINTTEDGVNVEQMLFTYSEEEREENSLNKLNASLVLKPQFITVDYSMLHNGYSLLETALYGFITYFLANNEKFYCTNEQLAEMLCVSENTITNAMNRLKKDGLINLTYKTKANGWKIRFVRLTKFGFPNHKICVSEPQNLWGIYNKKIENKKINIYMFQDFRKDFPHARKGKKKESEQYFKQQDAEQVKKQVAILKRKIKAWLQDAQYIPACERWIRDFTEINEDVLKQDLVRICKRHLNAEGDMKQRASELKETFWEEQIREIVKAIQQKDSPKNLFLKQAN